MKKLFALCGSIATMLLLTPLTILAAESGESSTATVPIWLCIPFAGLLLCIAVLPLVKPEWWEKNQPLAVAVWSLLFIIPFAVTYSAGDAVETVLECILNDYLTFIVLLFGLFCVAGNITLEGDLAGSPRVNVIFLAIGTLLSSCIGTTGATEIDALHGTVTSPTMLPGAAFFLGMSYPPAREMINAGLGVALASDYNPGSH